MRLLPGLIQHPKLVGHIYRMHWWVQKVAGKAEFLTSDHPCVYTRGLGNPDCVIAFPLSPQIVFFAANRSELEASFRSKPGEAIAVRTNQSVVSQAFKYVYGTSSNKRLFVKKHLTVN